jgi:hypothetical protein
MTKRARYDGPHEEVAVFDSEAGVHSGPIDVVTKGGLLSSEAPARIRDELLNTPYWSEVKQSDQTKANEKGDS